MTQFSNVAHSGGQNNQVSNLEDEYYENTFIINNPELDPVTNYYNGVKPCSKYASADEIGT